MVDAVPDLHSRELRAVLAVAEYRSFVAAAAGLKVSQPALTRTIKQLEAKLGVLLFARSTREVAATDAGKEFAALAERLINDLKIGVESVRERASEPRGQIVVASVISLASLISPRLIADFARRFGGVEIHLREGLQSSVRDDVRSGVADFGVGYVDRLPRLFSTERLGEERFHAVLPANHPLAAQRGDSAAGACGCAGHFVAGRIAHAPIARRRRRRGRDHAHLRRNRKPSADTLQPGWQRRRMGGPGAERMPARPAGESGIAPAHRAAHQRRDRHRAAA
jgi:DNA-binding transcriptional LysR family regulator